MPGPYIPENLRAHAQPQIPFCNGAILTPTSMQKNGSLLVNKPTCSGKSLDVDALDKKYILDFTDALYYDGFTLTVPNETARIALVGDINRKKKAAKLVADAINQRQDLDLLALLGDLTYSSDRSVQALQQTLALYAEHLATFTTLGNHDIASDNMQRFLRAINKKLRKRLETLDRFEKGKELVEWASKNLHMAGPYYFITIKSVSGKTLGHLVFIDSNVLTHDLEQQQWIDLIMTQLRADPAHAPIFLIMHHYVFDGRGNPRPGDYPLYHEIKDTLGLGHQGHLQKILGKYAHEVIAIGAHDHNQQALLHPCDMLQLILGGGGANLHGIMKGINHEYEVGSRSFGYGELILDGTPVIKVNIYSPNHQIAALEITAERKLLKYTVEHANAKATQMSLHFDYDTMRFLNPSNALLMTLPPKSRLQRASYRLRNELAFQTQAALSSGKTFEIIEKGKISEQRDEANEMLTALISQQSWQKKNQVLAGYRESYPGDSACKTAGNITLVSFAMLAVFTLMLTLGGAEGIRQEHWDDMADFMDTLFNILQELDRWSVGVTATSTAAGVAAGVVTAFSVFRKTPLQAAVKELTDAAQQQVSREAKAEAEEQRQQRKAAPLM